MKYSQPPGKVWVSRRITPISTHPHDAPILFSKGPKWEIASLNPPKVRRG